MNYKTSWMKKRVKVDVQMVREYLNAITSFIAGNSNPAVVPLVRNWKRFNIWSKLDTPETD